MNENTDTQTPSATRSFLQQAQHWWREEVVNAPLAPVLHPTPLRVKGLGLFTVLGHPLFWYVWSTLLPQPYENLPLRVFTCSLGLLLLSDRVSAFPGSKLTGYVFSAVIWFELPFLFNFMYLCNGGNGVWLASMAAMIMIYFFVTDWRLATVGLALAVAVAKIAFVLVGPASAAPIVGAHLVADLMTLGFCLCMGLLLGMSSANLRREQINTTLATIAIMAHELRTPLATIAMIGNALRTEAGKSVAEDGAQLPATQLVDRLNTVAHDMSRQIESQITNAALLNLPMRTEVTSASSLVREVLRRYPYRNERERASVVLQVLRDFEFECSPALFRQVIDNLMRNAFHALAAAGEPSKTGDLVLEVDVSSNGGVILVKDKGEGIRPELQSKIFDPFFSTQVGTGHGLGLAFCKRVILAAGGTIRVKSAPGRGAAFAIEVPLL